ncbi:hypothetical protein CGRA01v4_01872 [Colletotrichum graminicola]|nr:hypothetical protein CGRA01v4_01872 [Colletotrichum graminicola]
MIVAPLGICRRLVHFLPLAFLSLRLAGLTFPLDKKKKKKKKPRPADGASPLSYLILLGQWLSPSSSHHRPLPHPDAHTLDIRLLRRWISLFIFPPNSSPAAPLVSARQATRVKTGSSSCHFPVTNARASQTRAGRPVAALSRLPSSLSSATPFCSHHPITSCPLDHSVRSPFLVGRGTPAVDEAMACHRTNRGLGCLIPPPPPPAQRKKRWSPRMALEEEGKSIKGHMLSGLILLTSSSSPITVPKASSIKTVSRSCPPLQIQASSLHTLVSCRHLPSSHLNLVIPCLLQTSCPRTLTSHTHKYTSFR